MTSTVEIIKVLLKDVLTLKVLRIIHTKEYTLEELFDATQSYSKEEVEKSIKYLDSVALIDHVFRVLSSSFYRISARGARILEITEEAVIEENINGIK